MGLFVNKILWSLPVLLSFFLTFNGVQALHPVFEHLQSVSVPDQNIQRLHRTGYHFQPKKNWINDPNGPLFYRGVYHLFYQYNPKGAVWGNIVWAHSVSKDLINWEALEPAIYPSKPFDKYGCWSGSTTILPGDKPIILYTGIQHPDPAPGYQVQVYAVPEDYNDAYLRKWIKPDDNPIIVPDHGENVSQFRDPTTAWLENDQWNILVGGKNGDVGIAHLYKSKDFRKWTIARHPLHSKRKTGMWECPDFFPVTVRGNRGLDTSVLSVPGDHVKHVFKVSLDATRYEYYTIGSYIPHKDKYVPDKTYIDGWKGLRYDYGNFYASKTFFDPSKNRRVLWGWANESDGASANETAKNNIAKGWAGVQLIPRTLWLDPSGKQLLQWPVAELESLRGEKAELSKVKLDSGHHEEVKGVTAAQADVDVTFSFASLDKAEPYDRNWDKLDALDVCALKGSTVKGGLGPFGLLTLASKNLEEYTPVFFRVFKDENKYKVLMCSDATSSSLNKGMYKPSFAGYVDVDLAANKKISLRSLIDHSVVESFGAGGKTCITSRVYPTLAVFENAHLYVFNNGTEIVTVDKLEAWTMKKPAHMN